MTHFHFFAHICRLMNRRISDMSQQPDIFHDSLEYFTAEEEEVRAAAASCAGMLFDRGIAWLLTDLILGNISIGNLHQFLPVLVNMVQHDSKKRLLSLHALKEVNWIAVTLFILPDTAVSRPLHTARIIN